MTENKTGAAWEKYYSEEVIFAPDINPNLYTVINTHEVLTFDIAVQKKWADDANAWKTRPQDIELTLKQNGNKNITYKEDTIEKIEAYLAGGSIVEKGTQTGLSGVDSTTTATAAENRDIVHWYELPLYQPKTNAANKSVPYTYKVEEKGVVGYKVSYVGQQVVPVLSDAGSKKSVTVTNTLNRIEVQAKKNWSGDYNNAFQSRVGKLVFVLTVQDNDGALWYVEKKAASGYYEMTKTAPANASDAQTNYLTVTIDGTANGETKKLSVAIPKNHNGYKWSTAQLVEVNPPRGYTPAANGSAGTTTTTNTLTETVPLAVEKTWVETAYSYESQTMRPQPVFDIYYKHGEAAEWKDSGLDGYIKVTDRDDAKTVYDVFTDATCKTPFALPKTTGDGTTISYDAREKTMYGYTTVSDMHSIRTLGDGTFVVAETNAQELTDVTVRKEWREDDAWSVQTRPDAVTLTLQFSTNDAIWTNVKQSGQPVRVTLNEANNWSATVTGLAVKNARGNVIKYRFAEPDMEGYAVSYAAVAAKTAQVVTTTTGNTLRTVELSGSKVWKNDGVYGSSLRGSIALNVYQNEVLLDRSKYELSWNGWSYRITGLPRADKAGNLYTYRVEEDTESVSKAYAATDAKANPTSEDRYKLDDLVNTFRIIKLSGTKVWDDDNNRDGYRPDTVSLKLYQNQKLLTSGYTLTWEKTGNTWTYTFSNLPQRDASGNAYVYTVREESVANYETSYGEGKSEAEEGGRTVNPDGTEATASMTPITNIHEPKKIRIEGSKTWVDDDNRDGNRPTSITIRLYANGEEIKAQEVTKEDDWKWSFEDLYKYEDGKEIVYTVTEDEVNGYTTEVEGYDVTNLRSNALVSIRKTGDKGDALAGAEFCLYAAGEEPVIPEGDLPVAKATSGEDGIARFGAIDLGAYYLVEHEAPKGYVKSEALYRIIVKADGVTMEGLEDGVWIAVPDFTVANERERYEVEIIKTVSGEAGDHKKQFSFRVECSDEMEEGEGYTLSEDKKTATFLLRHDEHILLQGIPFGAALSVTEENLAADGYEMKLLIDGKSVKNPITVKEDLSITVNNSIEEVPDTGDSVTALPFILLLAASGISTLAVLLLKRRIRGAK